MSRRDGDSVLAILEANLSRLTRSLRKWRDEHRARIAERDPSELEDVARQALRKTQCERCDVA